MKDIFDKIKNNRGPLGQHAKQSHGYFTFPKLEGDIAPRMYFKGKEVLTWSINNYLGLSNHPEVRKSDAESAEKWGMGYPMGARMMSGHTKEHEELEKELADFMDKESCYLLNFGYQGCMSTIEALVDRNDVIVYDSESHACMVDGVRLHQGKRKVFLHNNMNSFEKQMNVATKIAEQTKGGILVVTEGVFGMSGDQGKLKEIIEFRKSGKYNFRLFVDDAHGFGTLGNKGQGAGEAQGIQDEIDVLFGTFAKSLPMPLVIGGLKRLELLKTSEQKVKLWNITNALQTGLRESGFNLGNTNSCVTPVMLSGTLGEATNLTFDLRENHNLFCSIVVYPVVPKDVILLRLIPTASHSLEDVEYTIGIFNKVKSKLDAGEYHSEKVLDTNS